MDVRRRLPAHPIPAEVRRKEGECFLTVDGLVRQPLRLGAADLSGLERAGLTDTFTCEEGWQVPDLDWRGVRLGDVLALAGPLPEARWVRASAGAYAVPLDLATAGQALLADELNGEPLTAEHGGPLRLVAPGSACFTSVKWVERLELTAEPGDETGKRIALARLRREP